MLYLINMAAAIIIGLSIGYVTGFDNGKTAAKVEIRNAVCENLPAFCK